MLKRLRKQIKGQSSIEYATLLILVIGALLAMNHYFKRGVQGRWKQTVDELGDQYDPRFADSSVLHTISTNTETDIIAIEGVNGTWTYRKDKSFSVDRRTGTERSGAY